MTVDKEQLDDTVGLRALITFRDVCFLRIRVSFLPILLPRNLSQNGKGILPGFVSKIQSRMFMREGGVLFMQFRAAVA